MARKSPTRSRRATRSPETVLVSDLNRQLGRARTASDPPHPRSATPPDKTSTLGLSDERAARPTSVVESSPDSAAADHDPEIRTRSLVILRAYEPAPDLEHRLSRIYARLSLPTIHQPEGPAIQ